MTKNQILLCIILFVILSTFRTFAAFYEVTKSYVLQECLRNSRSEFSSLTKCILQCDTNETLPVFKEENKCSCFLKQCITSVHSEQSTLVDIVTKTLIDFGYSQWSVFNNCSKQCGHGERNRTRQCVDKNHGCSGPAIEYKTCNNTIQCKDYFSIEFRNPTLNVPLLAEKIFPATSELTFCTWFKMDNSVTGIKISSLISYYATVAKIDNYFLVFLQEDTFKIYLVNNLMSLSASTTTLGKWNHFCFAWYISKTGNGELRIYENGKLSSEFSAQSLQYRTSLKESIGTVSLGQDIDDGIVNDLQQMFVGTLSQLFIFSKMLSNDQIIQVYNNNPPVDNRIVTWSEFKNKADGVDVFEWPHPF